MTRAWLILCIAFATVAEADQRPVLSLVIDDLGYSLDNGMAAIDLNGNHTYAILPGAAYSQKLAQHAHQQNKEVILHLPMQSINSTAAHEPNALNEAMDEREQPYGQPPDRVRLFHAPGDGQYSRLQPGAVFSRQPHFSPQRGARPGAGRRIEID
jgi:hypothetical protein